jgi:hypothetical protein
VETGARGAGGELRLHHEQARDQLTATAGLLYLPWISGRNWPMPCGGSSQDFNVRSKAQASANDAQSQCATSLMSFPRRLVECFFRALCSYSLRARSFVDPR